MLKWLVLLLFVACDIAVGVALIKVLLARQYSGSKSVEWALNRRRRRGWYWLLTLAVIAYVSLAPVFLFALIKAVRAW